MSYPKQKFDLEDGDVNFLVHCLRLMADQFRKDALVFDQARDMVEHTRKALGDQFRRQRDEATALAERLECAEVVTVGKEVE